MTLTSMTLQSVGSLTISPYKSAHGTAEKPVIASVLTIVQEDGSQFVITLFPEGENVSIQLADKP